MSDLTNIFTNIADAIRNKAGTTVSYLPTEMARGINNIPTGIAAMELVGPTAGVTRQFNMPVTIADNVTSMYQCFTNCSNFNQPVTIGNSVTNMFNCFYNCSNFNQPVTIGNNVISMYNCFYNCSNFNQPVTISNSVTNMFSCFYNCRNLNQPVTIGNSVTNMSSCFYNCRNLNQPVTILSTKGSLEMRLAFNNCTTLASSTVPIHISSAIPKDTSNAIYNQLVNNWTGIAFDPSRILNDA